ncbi:hypothetical protein NUW58_g7729 [Xylaria curta]|uniref:Uncharacterized protein n=1 Tax=Xylaria curta TaxID=42375 RepID=A0ACC1NFL1_9PEZI|nr:hypothetical protein NUW58_g7729 [Xylaria curta]
MSSPWQLWNNPNNISNPMLSGSPPHLQQLLSSLTATQISFIIVVGIMLLSLLRPENPAIPGAPVHGRRWRWEPALWLQSRFTFAARDLVKSGYDKYKDRPFILKRYDVDFNVLPHKYLDELRLVPETKLSGSRAQFENIGGKWTGTALAADSHVHFRAVQIISNSELPRFITLAGAELDHAWGSHFSSPKDWQLFDIQLALRNLVARMASPLLLGHPACRDERWLKLSVDYSINVITTAFTIRILPTWAQPMIAAILPARHRVAKNIRLACQIIQPLIEEHKAVSKRKAAGENVDKEITLLNWMLDNSTEEENKIDKIATRLAIQTLASVHTTTTAVSNIIFDLCAHPEWVPVLREEIKSVTEELGPIGSKPEICPKLWLQRLEKLDSFFVESQRFTPPVILGPQRVAMEPLTLKDGTYIPKGSRICWASQNHLNDPLVTSDPEKFDPMRSYIKRHSSPDEINKHLAGQTSPDNMSFGYGKLACPGRYYAVNQVKLLVTRLITQYDFKFPDNVKSRPQNLGADEFLFTDPRVKVMLKLRQDV